MKSLKDKGKYFNLNDCYMYIEDDVKEAVLELINYKKSCMYKLNKDYDEYDPNECNDYNEKMKANYQVEADIDKIKEIFGDW